MNPADLALLAMCIPLLGGVGILLCSRWPNLREAVTLVTALTLAGVVLSLIPGVLDAGFWAGDMPTRTLMDVMPGIPLAFHVEPLGLVYALIASILWVLNSLYAIGYMRGNHEKHQTRFFFWIAVAIACAMGAAFSANLFTLFVCYEALSLSTVPLVTHKGTPDAMRAGRTYLGILVATSVGLLLFAIIGIAVVTGGNINFQPGGVFQEYLAGGGSVALIGLLFGMSVYGIGKAGLMPVHRWLPAAMVAPTPVSALLHAVAVVKCGVFAVLKLTVYTFGPETLGSLGNTTWLVWAASFTIVCASAIAVCQNNFKRRLAYSTISQLSYIVLAAGLAAQGGAGASLAIAAGALHIIAHAFGKITLFFAAGNVYTAHHLTEVSQLDGIGRRMPITFGAFAVGALAMIGIPPTVGFLSKWSLLRAAWESGQHIAVVALLVSTLLGSIYLLEIVHRAFFRAPPAPSPDDHGHGDHHGDEHHADEAPWPMRIAISCTALATVLLFLFPQVALGIVQQLANGVMKP